MKDKPKLLSRRMAQKVVPLSDPTYWRMEQRGQLKAIRIGRSVFYREEDIDRLAAEGLPDVSEKRA